ncbi:thymidylate synthase [Gordonia phage GMA2]|uniref:Putative thymidylate synthase n=1 Tax=Gordonia phage GMA2 TaxID=1647283 RepID=A0A0K0N765_9CAUD|nr:thymidylate synthase [Gordonia phage GMA2]AKJ72582.1 putative thymidylate synthase [Gordonia phage GMA2]
MKIVKPDVRLLANTAVDWSQFENFMEGDEHATDAESLIEFAGRNCYLSWDKPNPKTRRNKDYLERTVFEQAHGSIAEHATATLYFTGVSRAFTHELIRHRHLSYSQLSQRFVDESTAHLVLPPAIRDNVELSLSAVDIAIRSIQVYRDLVEKIMNEGATRKQAREAARTVLPNGIETRIVVSGNMRAWIEVINRRTAPDADAEMIEVMSLAREQLMTVAPTLFDNRKEESND